jgi:aubergine-like protein
VLDGTIKKGKNLRSICNKILIQINAKRGGVPWSLTEMPFSSKPTMLIGLSSTKYKGRQTIVTIAATINNEFTRYFSRSKLFETDQLDVQDMFKDAFEAFKSRNKIVPHNIIVIRDGVGDSQKKMLENIEIPAIKQAIQSFEGMSKSKLLYSMANTKIKTKFFSNEHGAIRNPMPGTVIDHSVMRQGDNSFYLVSTHCRQGVPTPTHYTIMYDEVQAPPEEF